MSVVSELKERGLIYQYSADALLERLNNQRIVCYIGFDPSAESLHLGNLLQIIMLRRLQMAGHRPILLAGGGTGMIGDPSGKSDERQLLNEQDLDHNLARIKKQLGNFLELSESGNGALVLDNREWLAKVSLIDFLRQVGKHFSVNQMIQKDSIRSRLEEREQGISYTEFSYMLLQSYDFLHLFDNYNCELQLGGSDQWGNITSGIELIRRTRQKLAYGLTLPLVTKADGTKFGKSESGAIWLDPEKTSPYSLYQFFIRAEDEMVASYLRIFSFVELAEIEELEAEGRKNPQDRLMQKRLAFEMTSYVHGASEANRALVASEALYSGSLIGKDPEVIRLALSEAPSLKISADDLEPGLSIEELLARSPLVGSKGEARRVVSQGGVYVNEERASVGQVVDSSHTISGAVILLRRGKKDYCLVELV